MNQAPSKKSSEDGGLSEAYYALVRVLDYTWQEVMVEKVPQTMFSFQQLRVEGEEIEERQDEMESQRKKADQAAATGSRSTLQ
jgi:hypothetical protein